MYLYILLFMKAGETAKQSKKPRAAPKKKTQSLAEKTVAEGDFAKTLSCYSVVHLLVFRIFMCEAL